MIVPNWVIVLYFVGVIAYLVVTIIAALKGELALMATAITAAVLIAFGIAFSCPNPGHEKGVVKSSTPQVLVVEVKGFPLAVTPPKDEKLLVGDKVKLEEQDDGQWIVTEWLRTKKYE